MTSRPKARPRVLITRTRQQASELAFAVERMGAEPVLVPMIEVVQPASFGELDEAIQLLSIIDADVAWVIFTSANAVQALASRALELPASLHLRNVAAIGPATAKAIVEVGLATSIEDIAVPAEYVAESLAAMLIARSKHPQTFLLVRAEESRDVIPAQLTAAGHRVRIISAYRKQTPPATLPLLRRIFAEGASYIEVITFTSSSTAHNLIELLASLKMRIPDGVALASIGPITSATLRELGYEPTLEAEQATIESLAAAIANHLQRG